MLQVFLVMLREGLETFMIVAVGYIFINKLQNRPAMLGLYAGVAIGLLASVAMGIIFNAIGGVSPVFAGSLALLATFLIASCTYHMVKHGPRIADEIRALLQRAVDRGQKWAFFSIMTAIFLLVFREGVEIASALAVLVEFEKDSKIISGSILGVLGALAIAYSWAKFGRMFEMRIIYKASTLFMALFSVQLLFYAFHEFTEVSMIPLIDNDYWHIVTEEWSPEGEYGTYMTLAMFATPFLYLLGAKRSTLVTRA